MNVRSKVEAVERILAKYGPDDNAANHRQVAFLAAEMLAKQLDIEISSTIGGMPAVELLAFLEAWEKRGQEAQKEG